MHTALIQDGEHGLSVTPNEKAVAEALCHVGEENWESLKMVYFERTGFDLDEGDFQSFTDKVGQQ
tara:strand:+ start:6644 stop:6838 length:195 start_codon:yes stop_codon:yes gene_type:complete